MNEIEKKYQTHCIVPSDINEHLPTLYKYSKECDHITELGVRWVSSTWAFLMSEPKKLISYDIIKHPQIDELLNITKETNIDYTFINDDVLKVELEDTDLLFIDTLHTYNQLFQELFLHSSKSKKYIILHDTTSFGNIDEVIYGHASSEIKNLETKKQGLWNAILDFLDTEKGNDWYIFDRHHNNNGLTILKRK